MKIFSFIRKEGQTRVQTPIFSIAAGILTASSWLLPDSHLTAALGFLAAFFLVLTIHTSSNWKLPFLSGLIAIGTAFHWLMSTIENFGGFPWIAALGIYIFFVIGSASVFPIAYIFHKKLPSSFDLIGIRTAIAWTGVELLPYLIFPWKFGHTQIGFLPFAQIADTVGASGITFLIFWISESIYLLKIRKLPIIISGSIFIFSLAYGFNSISNIPKSYSNPLSISVIQANVSTEQKRDVLQFTNNLNRYVELTKSELGQGRLIIWPESVFQEWVHDGIRHQKDDPRLNPLPQNEKFLFGALTFTSETEYFNSALAILPDGSIQRPYHKRILMPFGEYTPLSKHIPFIASLNEHAANFTAGRKIALFNYPTNSSNEDSLKISPLICYEDIVPSMSQDAVMSGATALVNITNDAWFGNTVAPYQHHRIASFRAIENRRFLIRSTNSGLTALVAPTGETVSTLPVFSDGVLRGDIYPITQISWYTRLVGEWVGYVCLGISLIFYLISRLRNRL